MSKVELPDGMLEQLQKDHPFPWRQITHLNGLVQVADASNQEVGFLTINKIVIEMTKGVSNE